MTQKKRTHLYLPVTLWERLRSKAFNDRVSMSELAEKILDEKLPSFSDESSGQQNDQKRS
jgi:hypothetical protein